MDSHLLDTTLDIMLGVGEWEIDCALTEGNFAILKTTQYRIL